MDDSRDEEFLAALADVLEVPSVATNEDFRDTPLWGSLSCFAIKVMAAQRFGRTLSVKEISESETAGALMEKVFS